MELKFLPVIMDLLSVCSLLIVLNGIEIIFNPCGLFSDYLLIVLNGIEITEWIDGENGINAFNRTKWN